MTEKTEQVETIYLIPTWRGVLPILTLGIKSPETEQTARHELQRMADAADKWNAAKPMLREAEEYLQSIADSPDHIDSEGVAALLAHMKGLA